jgi:ankyrin repeat protein
MNDQVDVIRCLVEEYGANVNQANSNETTPLHIAAYRSHLDSVRCLVREFNANVDQPDRDTATPFQIAAENGNIEILRFMFKYLGADVKKAIPHGDTSLFMAITLFMAVNKRQLDVVRCLVCELGADVNIGMHDGFTSLMLAASRNNQVLIKHLVHKGAHVRTISTAGHTAVTELKTAGATAAQIAYLEVRECCANPGCDGGGRKRCAVCKETRYCGKPCQVAHWRVHREGCRPPIDAESEGSEVAL